MEALLEYDDPELSVYQPGYRDKVLNGGKASAEVNNIATFWRLKMPDGARTMIADDGAMGDSASVGVGFINAAETVGLSFFGLSKQVDCSS